MKLKRWQWGVLCLVLFAVSACAPAPKPTDICKFNIPVSQFSPDGNFDYIDFFDFAIEVAKENNFQPPMLYDKEKGLLVFGNEEVLTMPGLKMVVFMWVDNPSSGEIEKICLNSQLLDVSTGAMTEGIASEALLDFRDELTKQYKKRVEEMRRIFKQYQ